LRDLAQTERLRGEWKASGIFPRENPGTEVAFPYTRNLEVLYRLHEKKEVAGGAAVSLGGMLFLSHGGPRASLSPWS
jgi:hypothetical protein